MLHWWAAKMRDAKGARDIAAQKDLAAGPLEKQVLVFSVPLILSNPLQVLFNMADVAVVGRFAGTLALGFVVSTTILVSLISFDVIMVAGNSAATNADALAYDNLAAFYTACSSFMGRNSSAEKRTGSGGAASSAWNIPLA